MPSALLPRVDHRGQPLDCQRIALDPEAAQAGLGHRRDVGMVTKTLAREDVADVDLDYWHIDCRDRVADRHGSMSIGARVDDDSNRLLGAGVVDRIHDFALVVRLAKFDRELAPLRGLAAQRLDVVERRVAIGLGLARAEEIEIGAVEDVDGFRHRRSGAVTREGVPLYRDLARKGEAKPAQRDSTTGRGTGAAFTLRRRAVSLLRPSGSPVGMAGPGSDPSAGGPGAPSARRLAAARGVDLFLERIGAHGADDELGAHPV